MALNKILDFSALLLYCGLIYWLSAQQSLPTPEWFEHQDKLHHFSAYFVMGLLAWRSARHTVNSPIMLALVSIAFCSLYGASDEWHQSFVVGRSSDILDWLADTSGASAGIFLLHKLRKY
ncbi:teicoplanin resistance protein VanZ [Crenothrix sp. D3]|jgi:VanZ family protein|nr:teicoplanin resistance protein VanZ [Crenothrix sp. D3]